MRFRPTIRGHRSTVIEQEDTQSSELCVPPDTTLSLWCLRPPSLASFPVLLAHENYHGATHSPCPPCFVLLGPPGAGKGTLGVLLEKFLGFRHVSCGELLRQVFTQASQSITKKIVIVS